MFIPERNITGSGVTTLFLFEYSFVKDVQEMK
jgi:hypothetical protein